MCAFGTPSELSVSREPKKATRGIPEAPAPAPGARERDVMTTPGSALSHFLRGSRARGKSGLGEVQEPETTSWDRRQRTEVIQDILEDDLGAI